MLPSKMLGAKDTMGAYYVIRGKRSQFLHEAQTEVEAVAITREHFLEVLAKHPAKAEEITRIIVKEYFELLADAV